MTMFLFLFVHKPVANTSSVKTSNVIYCWNWQSTLEMNLGSKRNENGPVTNNKI